MKVLLTLFALVAAALACGPEELPCGPYCYNPTQYTCLPDPVGGASVLCGVGSSPCNGACIAECGYFCDNTTGLAVPNDDDELFCTPDCSAVENGGPCGNTCIDVTTTGCVSEVATPLSAAAFTAPEASKSSDCPFALVSTGSLWDGQLRLSNGPGAYPVQFTLKDGKLTDDRNQTCYISLGLQLQCNTPPQTDDTDNFGLSANGFLTHNGDTIFYQCPVGTGGYNIFTQPEPTANSVCTPVAIPTLSNCPTPPPACVKAIDLVIVIDVSGSINSGEYKAIKDFTLNFADNFNFGSNAGRIGLVWFGNSSYPKTSRLATTRTEFYAAANQDKPTRAESSCVGCGLQAGLNLLNANVRANVPQVLLLLSDGQSNVPQNTPRGCWKWDGRTCIGGSAGTLPAVNWVDVVPSLRANTQLTTFAVGVGQCDLQEKILKQIASPNSYVYVGAWNKLTQAIATLTAKSCPGAIVPSTSATPSTTKAAATTKAVATTTTKAATPSTTKSCVVSGKQDGWCFFDFDDLKTGSGSCTDRSGKGRHGSFFGSISSGFGLAGLGSLFSSKSRQYVTVPTVKDLSTAFSVSTWINLSGKSSSQIVVAASGNWQIQLCPTTNTTKLVSGSTTLSWKFDVPLNGFFHFAFTIDAQGNASAYKDGNKCEQKTKKCNILPKHKDNLYLCAHAGTFSGLFDDLWVHSKCLSQTEVQNVRNNHC